MVKPDHFIHNLCLTSLLKNLVTDQGASFSPFDAVTLKLVLGIFYPVWYKRDRIPRGPDHRDPLLLQKAALSWACCQQRQAQEWGPACPVKFIVHSIKGPNGQQRGLNVSPVT